MAIDTLRPERSYQSGFPMLKRLSWSAIFAGVLVAIVTQMLLTLLGLGIGLSTLDITQEQNPAAGLGTGSAIWYIVSSLLSLLIGGWVAGRLASTPRLFDGIIHGVLTWCLVTLLTIYFLTTAIGNLIGGAGRLLGGLVSSAGSVVTSAAPGLGNAINGQLKQNGIDLDEVDLSDLKDQANQLLRQTGNPKLNPSTLARQADQAGTQAQTAADQAASNPQGADDVVGNLFNQLFRKGQATVNSVDRDDAVNVIMKRTGKSRAEAEQTVEGWIKTYGQAKAKVAQTTQEAKVKASQAAAAAAAAASKGAIFGFFGLLIGVAAAGYGAKLGTDSKTDDAEYDRPLTRSLR